MKEVLQKILLKRKHKVKNEKGKEYTWDDARIE